MKSTYRGSNNDIMPNTKAGPICQLRIFAEQRERGGLFAAIFQGLFVQINQDISISAVR